MIISTIQKSLVRSINDLIDEVKTTTGDHTIQYWSWEARAEENTLPQVTLIGLDGFAFRENLGLWEVKCGITLSSFNDVNLHTEAEILDVIYSLFKEHSSVNLYEQSGEVFSQLTVTDFEIMPMGQSELRNYRMIALDLKRADTSEPTPQ